MSKQTTVNAKGASTTNKGREAKRSPGDDWRDTKTPGQCLAHLCLSEHLSDVSFTFVDEDKKLPAHKNILSMRNAVFEAMFNDPLVKKRDTVLIKDIHSATMKVLLRFLYTEETDLNGDNVISCLRAAITYKITRLVKQCADYLQNRIDIGNVCFIHEEAVLNKIEPLREKCFDYILEYASDIFATNGFLKISHETLYHLLKDDKLSAEELDVFIVAVRWAQDKCEAKQLSLKAENVRKILNKVLFEIRFPTMSAWEFAKVVAPTGLLTNEEQLLIYHYKATQNSSQLDEFNKDKRTGETVIVDLTKHSNARYEGYQQGLLIQISEVDEFYDCEGSGEMSLAKHSLRVNSVKGTFVQYVQRVTIGNDSVDYYKIASDRILFKTPIVIYSDVTIQFHPTDEESVCNQEIVNQEKSNRINIEENINGQMVNFGLVPFGLETISIGKKYI